MILPPTSEIIHHQKVSNITVSPTSLSPIELEILVTYGLFMMGLSFCEIKEASYAKSA